MPETQLLLKMRRIIRKSNVRLCGIYTSRIPQYESPQNPLWIDTDRKQVTNDNPN